ncbi:hypothetical protein PsYK624_166820 [Phanerochaete sordida]|uniref:Uncharacterized protein n=1 Tax=Phanerochaete sordida TaxID=48140 RepID=A0A9P3GTG7_9APHY|nr:hypothetical protein PsYK624_166820 [Phanerochaete sordida]
MLMSCVRSASRDSLFHSKGRTACGRRAAKELLGAAKELIAHSDLACKNRDALDIEDPDGQDTDSVDNVEPAPD